MKTKTMTLLLLACCRLGSAYAQPIGTPDISTIEYPDDTPPSPAAVELGKLLYFDPRLSKNKNIACATCHNPDLGFSDGVRFSLGTDGGQVGRNTPHIYNLAWASLQFWDGRAGSLEEQALGPIEAKGEMNLSLDEAVLRLKQIPGYVEAFDKAYKSTINSDLLAKAIAAFERSIVSKSSSFDKYMAGDKNAMSPNAVNGMALFIGKGRCTQCHDGANFTDGSFHNIGVLGKDPGRGEVIKDKSLQKAFKTPGLRNVVLTAPYMHDGSLGSLEEVIRFYNRGGDAKKGISKLIKPLNLSEQEIYDLLAFLGALTDPLVISRPELP